MEQLLKNEIVGILNEIQRGSAPHITGNDIAPAVVNISDHKFDLADSKGGTPIRNFEEGSAHYINGNEGNTYSLKIISYDDFLHQFTFDDGNGHPAVSRLKDGVRVADFLMISIMLLRRRNCWMRDIIYSQCLLLKRWSIIWGLPDVIHQAFWGISFRD